MKFALFFRRKRENKYPIMAGRSAAVAMLAVSIPISVAKPNKWIVFVTTKAGRLGKHRKSFTKKIFLAFVLFRYLNLCGSIKIVMHQFSYVDVEEGRIGWKYVASNENPKTHKWKLGCEPIIHCFRGHRSNKPNVT